MTEKSRSQPLRGFEPDTYVNENPNSLPIHFNYGFIILFNWSVEIMKPFKVFPRRSFGKDEICDYWIDNKLEDQWRIKKLKALSPLPGQKMSLFAKVEDSK